MIELHTGVRVVCVESVEEVEGQGGRKVFNLVSVTITKLNTSPSQ